MKHNHPSCHTHKSSIDYLFWISSFLILAFYIAPFLNLGDVFFVSKVSEVVTELIHRMWFGITLGVVLYGLLDLVPRSLIMSILGKGGKLSGILRATIAGVLLDLCSHGILMVGMRLYERGASIGQTMAFLIASPWNSISLTLILWTLIGLKLTILILALSMIVAVVSGLIFDSLVSRGILPENKNKVSDSKSFIVECRELTSNASWNLIKLPSILWKGAKGSVSILRWIFFGILLAALVRTLIPTELFQTYFGPTLIGLGLTLVVATIMEVCSEGSTPLATEFVTRSAAPGNAFGFLMAGVSTDYTEVALLKETTKNWKIALFLPLVTLPQIILISIILNSI